MLTFLSTERCFICSYITPIIYLLSGSQRPLIKKTKLLKEKKKERKIKAAMTQSLIHIILRTQQIIRVETSFPRVMQSVSTNLSALLKPGCNT